MTSKKPTASKRAAPPRECAYTSRFRKDWERLSKSGRYDMTRLKHVMMLLVANDEPLGAEWKDHPLRGPWAGYRECHIGGDFLLVYKLTEDGDTVIFTAAGTHTELFD